MELLRVVQHVRRCPPHDRKHIKYIFPISPRVQLLEQQHWLFIYVIPHRCDIWDNIPVTQPSPGRKARGMDIVA